MNRLIIRYGVVVLLAFPGLTRPALAGQTVTTPSATQAPAVTAAPSGNSPEASKAYSAAQALKDPAAKLNALRKSLGDDIADRAFVEWMDNNGGVDGSGASDKNAGTITDALQPLIDSGKLRIPRGGYVLRRGRGRVIIERPEAE